MAATFTVSRASLIGLRVSAGLLHSLSIVATGFRLVHRKRRKQLASDDWWALVAACFNAIVFSFFWVRISINDDAFRDQPTSMDLSQATYYLMSIAFTCTLWSARISIACSILRVLHGGWIRTLVLILAWLFLVICIVLVAVKSWICDNSTWTTDCPLGRPFGVAKLTTDVMSNFALVTIPLYILWKINLPRVPRHMIRAVFATSILTTSISAMHLVYSMGPNRFLDGYTAHFESAITVLVCNLLVLVMYLYRRIRGPVDEEDVDSSDAPSRTGLAIAPMSFTRITDPSSLASNSDVERGTSVFPTQDLQDQKETHSTS